MAPTPMPIPGVFGVNGPLEADDFRCIGSDGRVRCFI